MHLGMIGLGRMGAGLVRRLAQAGHPCVVYDANTAAVKKIAGDGVAAAASISELLLTTRPFFGSEAMEYRTPTQTRLAASPWSTIT